ncbi:hypothetical protein [Xanthomonas arboricola]|uniref:hypothetical protein n=1 Tax=Xanthomonas arboricola TaxID=56448 RepID=UPI000CEE1CBC|nr:hypothetical protein [Xanthomonas arboricola]PPU19393.1 hypothetical protein XarbCFBP7610_12135 [Xanthomonas arboricola]
MELSKAVGIFFLALLFINYLLFMEPSSAPNLGHRVRWRRWLHRALAYPICHTIGIALANALLDQLASIIPTQVEAIERNYWMILVILPLPFSLALMKLGIWSQRFLGYEQWPKPPAIPAWVPAQPRLGGFEKIDLQDDALVQELARSHWNVMHEALMRDAPLYDAYCLQRAFLNNHLLQVEPQLAESASKTYQQEMIRQALIAEAHRAATQAAHGPPGNPAITEKTTIH